VVFDTTTLISKEFAPRALKAYIGTFHSLLSMVLTFFIVANFLLSPFEDSMLARIDKKDLCTGPDIGHRHQASDIGTCGTSRLGDLIEIVDHVSGPPEMRVLKVVYK